MSILERLPTHLFALILERLSFPDYIRCGAVCSSWHAVVSGGPIPSHHQQVPSLMLPRSESDERSSALRFYSPALDHEFSVRIPSGLRWSRCISTSNGFLFAVDRLTNPFLFNPLSRAHIPLPPSTTLPELDPITNPDHLNSGLVYTLQLLNGSSTYPYDISADDAVNFVFFKAVVAWTSESSYTVFIVHYHGYGLAFAREGDVAWTVIENSSPPIEDLVFYRGRLYACRRRRGSWFSDGTVAVESYDVAGPSPVLSNRVEMHLPEFIEHRKSYLVELSGHLLLVFRKVDYHHHKRGNLKRYLTSMFKVFRLEFRGDNVVERVEMKDLGENALFLGDNNSVSVSTREFPLVKRNCIYFTDDFYRMASETTEWRRDMGVFDLENASVRSIYPQDLSTWPLASWLTFNLSKQGTRPLKRRRLGGRSRNKKNAKINRSKMF